MLNLAVNVILKNGEANKYTNVLNVTFSEGVAQIELKHSHVFYNLDEISRIVVIEHPIQEEEEEEEVTDDQALHQS